VYCSARCSIRYKRRKRRGRETSDGDCFRWTQVIKLFLAFDRCCAYCQESIDGQPDPDHVIALSRGGHNTISNVLPSCRPCNSDKRDLTLDEWKVDRARRGLPPVVTVWNVADHRYTHLALRSGATVLL
jgi:5-methylcytosine-specific restriction endonuclease McrA